VMSHRSAPLDRVLLSFCGARRRAAPFPPSRRRGIADFLTTTISLSADALSNDDIRAFRGRRTSRRFRSRRLRHRPDQTSHDTRRCSATSSGSSIEPGNYTLEGSGSVRLGRRKSRSCSIMSRGTGRSAEVFAIAWTRLGCGRCGGSRRAVTRSMFQASLAASCSDRLWTTRGRATDASWFADAQRAVAFRARPGEVVASIGIAGAARSRRPLEGVFADRTRRRS